MSGAGRRHSPPPSARRGQVCTNAGSPRRTTARRHQRRGRATVTPRKEAAFARLERGTWRAFLKGKRLLIVLCWKAPVTRHIHTLQLAQKAAVRPERSRQTFRKWNGWPAQTPKSSTAAENRVAAAVPPESLVCARPARAGALLVKWQQAAGLRGARLEQDSREARAPVDFPHRARRA